MEIIADELEVVRTFFKGLNETNARVGINEEFVIHAEGDNYGTKKITIAKQGFNKDGEITYYEVLFLILPEFNTLIAKIEGFSVQFRYRDPQHLIQLLSELIHYV